MNKIQLIEKRIQKHVESIQAILNNQIILCKVAEIAEVIVSGFLKGNKVYFCGNGGSAADAQHLATELLNSFYLERGGLPAEALHCNTSYITAVANDHTFDEVYARYMAGVGQPGDILVGITTSGNSLNILKAFEICKEREITTIAMTGHQGGQIIEKADYSLIIPSSDTPRIQEGHILLGHIICEIVEATIFETPSFLRSSFS
ncbi:MAG: SIS domain-containing protein [Bacteroides oleiciplenus]|nr:SIS domain-containing protein [Bacteroides oleiciplenus]